MKRGKLYPEQGQVGGRVPVRRDSGAPPEPSGRPHEPPGNRRPQMDDRRRALGESGTEPGVQAASLTLPPRPPDVGQRLLWVARRGHRGHARDAGVRRLRRSMSREGPDRAAELVAALSPRRRGRCASPCRRCRSAWRSPGRRAASGAPGPGRGSRRRGPLPAAVHGDQAAERAAADPRCRQERLRDRRDGWLGHGHGGSALVGAGPVRRRSLAPRVRGCKAKKVLAAYPVRRRPTRQAEHRRPARALQAARCISH